MSFREQIQSQRQAARDDAAEAASAAARGGKKTFWRGRKQPKTKRTNRQPLASHKSFVPLVAGWGAAFAGLVIAVLPAGTIASITQTAQLTALGGFSRIVLAVLAALFGGLIALAIARAVRNAAAPLASEHDEFEEDHGEVRPIDPSAELGSESLDAPIEAHEVAEVPSDEYDVEVEFALDDVVAASDQDGVNDDAWIEAAEISEEPLELGEIGEILGAAELAGTGEVDAHLAVEPESEYEYERPLLATKPGKSAPPVLPHEEPQPEPAPEPVVEPESELEPEAETELEIVATPEPMAIPEDAPDFLKGSAVKRLREMPTEDMSLMQMVERFATALHTHQAAHGKAAQPRRDAALAEALRALSLFTDNQRDASSGEASDGFTDRAQQTERELREALAKLQKLSGAA